MSDTKLSEILYEHDDSIDEWGFWRCTTCGWESRDRRRDHTKTCSDLKNHKSVWVYGPQGLARGGSLAAPTGYSLEDLVEKAKGD